MPVLHSAKVHPAVSGPLTLEDGTKLTAQAGACFLPLEITPADMAHVDALAIPLARTIPFLSVHADPRFPDLPELLEKAMAEVEFRAGGPSKIAKVLKDAVEAGTLNRDDLQHTPEVLAGLEAWFAKTEPKPEPAPEKEEIAAGDVGKLEEVIPDLTAPKPPKK